jgi:hypothetical protein
MYAALFRKCQRTHEMATGTCDTAHVMNVSALEGASCMLHCIQPLSRDLQLPQRAPTSSAGAMLFCCRLLLLLISDVHHNVTVSASMTIFYCKLQCYRARAAKLVAGGWRKQHHP